MVSVVQYGRGVRAAIPHCRAVLSCIAGECGWLLYTASKCYVIVHANAGGCYTLMCSSMVQSGRVWVAAAHDGAVLYRNAGE